MKGDGNELGAGEVSAKEWILDGYGYEVRNEEGAAGVFDFVDDLSDVAAGTEGTDRATEGWVKVEAMRAGAVAFEDTFERVTASMAAGIVDAFELAGSEVGQVQLGLVVHG